MDSSALLHFVTEPTRNAILTTLLDGERTVSQITQAVDAEQSNVSHHLRTLRDAGLVRARRDGRRQHYRLAEPELERILTDVRFLADRLERITYLVGLELPTDPAFHGYG